MNSEDEYNEDTDVDECSDDEAQGGPRQSPVRGRIWVRPLSELMPRSTETPDSGIGDCQRMTPTADDGIAETFARMVDDHARGIAQEIQIIAILIIFAVAAAIDADAINIVVPDVIRHNNKKRKFNK